MLSSLLAEFLSSIAAERAQRTVITYEACLRRFVRFAGEISPSGISEELISRFRYYLANTQKSGRYFSAATQNTHLAALRAFLDWLRRKKGLTVIAKEAIRRSRSTKRSRAFLKPEEVEAILTSCEARTLHGLRDRALLELLAATGLRASELVAARREAVDLEQGLLWVSRRDDRLGIPLGKRATNYLSRWLARRRDQSPTLFIRLGRRKRGASLGPTDEGRLTVRQIERILQKYARRAGIARSIGPQLLRASLAHALIAKGEEIRRVQRILGHAHSVTTRMYSH